MYIFLWPGLASCRCRPLSSNVRPHKNARRTARSPMVFIALTCLLLLAVLAALVSLACVKSQTSVIVVVIGVALAHVFQFVFGTAVAVLATHPLLSSSVLALWQIFIANVVVVTVCVHLRRRGRKREMRSAISPYE